jgi:tetratricopeptide (TPR) repeat protein
MALAASTPAWADGVSGSTQDGYGRLSFSLTSATNPKITASATGGVLTISFSAKTGITPASVVAALPRILSSGRADPDGKTLRFVLVAPVKLHVSQIPGHAVVDLAPSDFSGKMPDLVVPPKPVSKPIDVASLPEIKMRAGSYEKFTRLVFDWPKNVSYQVFPGAGKMTVKFDAPIRMDVSAVARFAPPWVKNVTWRVEGATTLVEFQTDSDSGYHDFKDGNHVVLDILAPRTDGAAYAPPGIAKPTISKMEPVPAAKTAAMPSKPVAGASTAQAQAVLQTAQQLAGKNKPKESPQPPAKPEAKPETKTAAAQPAASPTPPQPELPTVPVADGKRTRDGALINFKGAGALPSAVFVRGLTAWVVLENAPSFDSRNLKSALGDFAAGVEAVSSNGLGILRITLKQPAEISARSDGNNLVVEIAGTLAPAPVAIGFARNQDDPRRSSLSTLLPAADHAFRLLDPAGGDMLTIVPTQAGRGMPATRHFADFAALPTASGLVITPYADDLNVSVNASRVTISRPGGLMLTPPQMPVGQTPSALARFGDGPSYLDFAHWRQATAGSFLATQRELIQSAVHAYPQNAARAQLTLTRFYLANGFGAEALGLIKLIQTKDPSLTGDVQLTTMKAAAEYMMGRYRDAHNDLAGPGFDSDRHAAFWRGLIEAAMENWKDAHAHLEQAGPVMNRYTPEWQARAYLAEADAGLGMGRLDLADAALTRVPKNIEEPLALAAELTQARLLSAENRYDSALAHFTTVEKSGNEKLAAQAIFYHTNAGLAAGAISPPQAIEQFERLRFRWRGDGLELKTLRKLAALYFDRGQWRDGLRTLRIVTQNFKEQDATRVAQDDMRGAFINLFLKGGADKMKPVDALALFYDNLDLTPVGPDGDEMIRRMSDRLVAVDLLGPAANLLAYQVDKRLDGVAKAQVATRLAAVYLMDHKPDKAVAAIRDSQISGLPDDQMHQRMILEARAFAALKQWDNALDLIAVDQADDTKRLRADIYWESGNWAVAGQKAEELLQARASEPGPFSDADRAQVLRAAVAYSLANDETSLARLREHFAPRMKGTPDANLFAVLSADIDQHSLAFRDAAAKIASVDTLESFMKDFNKRRSDAKS